MKLICDLIWFGPKMNLDLKLFGFDLIICYLIFDLRFWFKPFLPMICNLDLWFDLWFARHWHKSCEISETVQDRTKDSLLLRTNRKSHTRFWLVPTSMTLDDLEWLKLHSCRNKIVLRSPDENFNDDRSITLAAKCRPMILVSKSIKCMGICAGVM